MSNYENWFVASKYWTCYIPIVYIAKNSFGLFYNVVVRFNMIILLKEGYTLMHRFSNTGFRNPKCLKSNLSGHNLPPFQIY